MTDAAGNFDLVTFLVWVGGIVVGAYLIHLLATWAESRGWIYYRSSRGGGSAALSNAMSEFEAVINPAAEHRLEEERSGQVEDDESDLPLDDEAAASPALLAAGYSSPAAARRALANLEAQRDRLLDQRIPPSAVGDDDLGGGMNLDQRRELNRRMDIAGDLARIEDQIARLRALLA
ncbi:MAG TPA: hypothetical protein VLB85_01565 [Acidimicrobiia bacterium]|nr:hypothetical protein [Acidimicrobiia bacterium]